MRDPTNHAERLWHRPRPSIRDTHHVEALRSRSRPSLPRLVIDDSDRPSGKEAGFYECIAGPCREKAVYRVWDPLSDVIEFYCEGHIDHRAIPEAEFLGVEIVV